MYIKINAEIAEFYKKRNKVVSHSCEMAVSSSLKCIDFIYPDSAF